LQSQSLLHQGIECDYALGHLSENQTGRNPFFIRALNATRRWRPSWVALKSQSLLHQGIECDLSKQKAVLNFLHPFFIRALNATASS